MMASGVTRTKTPVVDENNFEKAVENDIIKKITIYKSLGAAAINYPVKDVNGFEG